MVSQKSSNAQIISQEEITAAVSDDDEVMRPTTTNTKI